MKPFQKFNPRTFWILVYTIRELIFKNFSADFLFYLKNVGNHLNHILSQILYLVWYIASSHFFIELFTETIIDILLHCEVRYFL